MGWESVSAQALLRIAAAVSYFFTVRAQGAARSEESVTQLIRATALGYANRQGRN